MGQVESLDVATAVEQYWKAHRLDLRPLLRDGAGEDSGHGGSESAARRCTSGQDHGLDAALDHELIAAAGQALKSAAPVEEAFPVRNVHRSVGTMLGYEVTRRYGGAGLPDGTIDFTLTGSAGQSFGAFLPKGITLRLVGDANDYFGKGLSGGHLVLRPHEASPSPAERQVIAGNVALYGATAGEAFISGQVGERFCVRNSGATAVVEGVGDHACEYMTGGSVLVLGPTGRNFAAGMSGGTAYVYDPDGLLKRRCNLDMVTLEDLDAEDERLVADLLRRHVQLTGSALAARLAGASSSRAAMRKVMPIDYRRVLEATRLAIETGRAVDEAIMAAAHG